MKVRVLAVSLVLSVILAGSLAYAQQSNFSITPPPLASPTFEKGQKEAKFRLSVISIEGEGFEMSGAGVDIVPRVAFSDHVAGNFQFGVFSLAGESGTGAVKSDLAFSTMQLGLNLEIQPLKTEHASLILFGGPSLNLGVGSLDYTYTFFGKTYADTIDINTSMFGVQGGAQVGVKLGPFHIDPFAMVTNQSGTSTASTSFSTTTSDIPSFTTTSYGVDIMIVPWNLSLSSVLQKAAESGSNKQSDTTIVQLGWRMKF